MLHILKDVLMLKIYSKQLIIKGDFIKNEHIEKSRYFN